MMYDLISQGIQGDLKRDFLKFHYLFFYIKIKFYFCKTYFFLAKEFFSFLTRQMGFEKSM